MLRRKQTPGGLALWLDMEAGDGQLQTTLLAAPPPPQDLPRLTWSLGEGAE